MQPGVGSCLEGRGQNQTYRHTSLIPPWALAMPWEEANRRTKPGIPALKVV